MRPPAAPRPSLCPRAGTHRRPPPPSACRRRPSCPSPTSSRAPGGTRRTSGASSIPRWARGGRSPVPLPLPLSLASPPSCRCRVALASPSNSRFRSFRRSLPRRERARRHPRVHSCFEPRVPALPQITFEYVSTARSPPKHSELSPPPSSVSFRSITGPSFARCSVRPPVRLPPWSLCRKGLCAAAVMGNGCMGWVGGNRTSASVPARPLRFKWNPVTDQFGRLKKDACMESPARVASKALDCSWTLREKDAPDRTNQDRTRQASLPMISLRTGCMSQLLLRDCTDFLDRLAQSRCGLSTSKLCARIRCAAMREDCFFAAAANS